MRITRLVSPALMSAGVAAAFLLVGGSRTTTVLADGVRCDLSGYKASPGLTAVDEQGVLAVTWSGQNASEVRARLAVVDGQPVMRELAVRKTGAKDAAWTVIGENLTPDYRVVSGMRRLPSDQGGALSAQGVKITREVIDKNRWYAFWDAPLLVPGTPPQRPGDEPFKPTDKPGADGTFALNGGRVYELPRHQEEVKRAASSFKTTACTVKTEGASVEVTFPGLSMGIFSGDLRFTMYKGSNLFQMDALASTSEKWVAYIYSGGFKGFSTQMTPSVTWRDTGGGTQVQRFGGPVTTELSPVKAANRLMVAEGKGAALAVTTPPHSFFFTREKDTNLGYVYYRKDAEGRFSMGIRMAEGEEPALGPRLSDNPDQYAMNFALYNAPPGTKQKMSVFFLAVPGTAETARTATLALTHNDVFKPVAGYKTFVNHFHLALTDRARGHVDTPIQDALAMKAIGLNIVGMSDFHFELQDGANDVGPIRFKQQREYFEATKHLSDVDFLVTPWEEPSAYFGGHYNLLGPKPVYWAKFRQNRGSVAPESPYTEKDPEYGTVYRAGSAADMEKFLEETNQYWYTAHPRTKNSANFPDAYWAKPYGKSDRFLGIAWKPGMGQDMSEDTLCEWRCFDAIDAMNNQNAGSGVRPKYLIGDVDTYKKGPEDDLYAGFPVNYLQMDRVPAWGDDWTPVLSALREGRFFATTGEVLIRNYAVTGTGQTRTLTADVDWTYPPAFIEIVMGDGKAVTRKRVSLRDQTAFGTKKITQTVDVTGQKWIRMSVWDVATNGALVQPVWIK